MIKGKKTLKVHRLVAYAFIPNDDLTKTQINHKDECKTNNYVFVNKDGTVDLDKSNLEWCTNTYNHNYGTINERIAKSNTNNPKRCKPIHQYSLDGTFIQTFQSAREIERQLGFCDANICKCCLNKKHYNTAYGFIWKYA